MFIRLLGAVGAGPDEDTVTDAPGQVAAGVLAHLALAGGRLVTADALADAVWDDPPDTARNAIQVAVSKLRKQYGQELIESTRAGYRLPTGIVRIDWAEAVGHLAQAREAMAAGRAADALVAAEALAELYAGEPLAGLATTAADTARQQARELRTAGRLVQARALVALNRAPDAIPVLRAEAADDPLGEPAHVALMEALAVAGRPNEALAVYDELRRRLADELGADPSPAAGEVFARLLDGTAAEVAAPPKEVQRTIGVRLPAVASPILGRAAELTRIAELVSSGHRLVTLLGPGGIGKTRLALAAAHRVAEAEQRPAVFVDLTAARSSSEVEQTIATALDVEVGEIAAGLRGSRALVVLDNAEHILDGVVDAVTGLLDVPDLAVLVTSRTPLKLRDERTISVDVLRADRVDAPAVRLLIEKAELAPDQVSAQADDLLALARLTDGIPLVLELLASAMRWYTPKVLLKQVDTLLLELTDDARDRPERHLSVGAAVDWSIRQATEPGRQALGALTVARGSFSLEAAQEILSAAFPAAAPAKVLGELVDLSLLQRLPDVGQIRFRILQPIRLHATSSPLVLMPSNTVCRAHAVHYLRAASRADEMYARTAEPGEVLLRNDSGNLTAALEWSWKHEPATAMAALGPVLYVWYYGDRYSDVLDWSERALASDVGTPVDRARVSLARLATLLWLEQAEEHEVAAHTEIVRPHVDAFNDEWHRRWIYCQAESARSMGDIEAALRWQEQYRVNNTRDVLRSSLERGHLLVFAGRLADAATEIESMLKIAELADHPVLHALGLNARGYIALMQGDVTSARTYLDRAKELSFGGDNFQSVLAQVSNNQAWLALQVDLPERALQFVADNLKEYSLLVDRLLVVESAVIVGLALLQLGRNDEARAVAGAVVGMVRSRTTLLDPYGAARLEELKDALGLTENDVVDAAQGHLAALVERAVTARN